MTDLIERLEKKLAEPRLAIQQPRTTEQIANFVIGQHLTDARRWHQCVLEMDIKLNTLAMAAIDRDEILRKIEKHRAKSPDRKPDKLRKTANKIRTLERHLHIQDAAVLGAERELSALEEFFDSFGRTFTHEEIQAAEEEYWNRRLTEQVRHDVLCRITGINPGNLQAMREADLSPMNAVRQAVEMARVWGLGAQLPDQPKIEERCELNSQTPLMLTSQTPVL